MSSMQQENKAKGMETSHTPGTIASMQICWDLEMPIYQHQECFNHLMCWNQFQSPVIPSA